MAARIDVRTGHDRMLGDLRPLAHRRLGIESALVCHPYDICTCMLLEEAGGIVEDPWGRPLDVPLDMLGGVADYSGALVLETPIAATNPANLPDVSAVIPMYFCPSAP